MSLFHTVKVQYTVAVCPAGCCPFLSPVVVVVPPILVTLQGCNEVLKETATVENVVVNININWYTDKISVLNLI